MLGIFKSLFGKNSDGSESAETAEKKRLQKFRDRKLIPATDAEDASASLRDLVQSKAPHEGVSPFKVWTGVEGKAHSVGITNKAMVSPFKGGAFGYSENPLDDDIDQLNKDGYAETSAKKKLQLDLSQSVLSSLIEKHGQIERTLDPDLGTASGQYDIASVKDSVLASDWSSGDSLFSDTGLFCDYGDTLTESPFPDVTADESEEHAEKAKCFGPPLDLNKLEKPKERKPAIVLDDDEFIEEVLFHYDNCESLFEDAVEEDEVDDDSPEEIRLVTGTPAAKTDLNKAKAATAAVVAKAANKAAAVSSTAEAKSKSTVAPSEALPAPAAAVPAPASAAAVPASGAASAPAPPSAAPTATAPGEATSAQPDSVPSKTAPAAKNATTQATKPGQSANKIPAQKNPAHSANKLPAQSSSKLPAAKPNQSSNRLQAAKPSQTANRLQALPEDGKKNLQLSDLCESMEIKQFSHPYDKFSESSLKLLAQNPKTPPGALAWLAAHRNPHIRAAVAKNPGTPIETFWVLARDHESSIRYSIAENPNMSPEILRELSRDRNPLIATTAQNVLHSVRESLMNALPPSSLFSKKTTASGQSIEALKPQADEQLHGDDEFLLMISGKTTTPARRLKELANHSSAKIRAAVAENGNTPSDVLWLMARDSDPNVKIKLAQNCNLPEEILDVLKEDKDSMVAKAAQKVQTKLAGLRLTGKAGGSDVRHVITWS